MDCRLIAAIPINGIKNSFPGNVPGLNARIFRFRAKTEGKVGVNAKIDAAFGFGTGAALGLLPSIALSSGQILLGYSHQLITQHAVVRLRVVADAFHEPLRVSHHVRKTLLFLGQPFSYGV